MSISADRNLLFGILALQMDFITREQLITGMQGWMADKSRPLGEILVSQQAMQEPDRTMLEAMVNRHIQMHGADPARSLAAVSSVESSLKEALRSLADPAIEASMTCLPARAVDSDATRSHPGGATNVPGTRFKILRFHAQGGLGQVSVALDSELNREVAFKEIQPRHAKNEEARSRFVLEAEVTGRLEHPGIVPVYGLGHHLDGRPFYAMKFIKGDSLKQAIERYHSPAAERVPNDKAIPTLRDLLGRFIDVCQAMQYAHVRGVLHRDLKPGNIMLGKYGETLVVDWGLAKLFGQTEAINTDESTLIPAGSASGSVEMTQPGGVVGTPAYMSPEQAAGRLEDLGPASDVYSLGATLYHLLTGRVPFEGEDVLQKVQRGDFRRPRAVRTDIPSALEAICLKAMNLNPGNRYHRPADLAADIEHWLADEPVSALPEKVTARLARIGRRNRAWVQAGMAALVLIAVVTAWGYVREAGLRSNLATTNQSLTTALLESTRRLAQSHFQRGVNEYAAGRQQNSVQELAMAYTLAEKADPLRSSYMRVLQDRLRYGGRSFALPLRHEGFIHSVAFSPDGTRVLTISDDNTARLWDGRTGAPLGEPLRHEDGISSVAFSPDGTRVLTGSRDHTARLWDGRTGTPLGESLRHEDEVQSVTFSPDGTRILTGSNDNTGRLWDGRTGARLGEPMRQTAPVAFSPDGTRVLTRSYDNTARLWDGRTGTPLGEPMRHDKEVKGVEFSPDGTRVLTGSWDHTARLWDGRTGAPLGEPMRHEDDIYDVAFSPDGTRVLTGAGDYQTRGEARLWDGRTGAPLGEPMRHMAPVSCVEFSPDGTRVLAISIDHTARLWDGHTGTPLGEPMRHEDDIYDVEFSPDGTRVLTGSWDHTARLWDGRTGAPLGEPMRHEDRIHDVAFSPDGTRVLTGSYDSTARLWDGRASALLLELIRHGGGISSVALSPDGTRVLTGSWDHTARLWDGHTGTPLGEPMRHENDVYDVAFSLDGTRVLTGSRDHTARLWDGRTGAPLGEPMRHEDDIYDVAFSPDGTRVLTGSRDHTARLWDGHTGTPLGEPMRHEDDVYDVAFSLDGTRVLTGSRDHAARLWDGHTGTPLGEPMRHEDGISSSVAFSPDGTRVLTGSWDHTARLWDGHTGAPLGEPMRHEDGISSVAFSPDGTRVLTGSWDHTARLWDGHTGTPLGEPMRHEDGISSVAFSPDGIRVLTGSRDHTARLWDGRTGAPLGEPMQHEDDVNDVAFSLDGTRVLTGSDDGTARQWDATLLELPEEVTFRLVEYHTGKTLNDRNQYRSLSEEEFQQRQEQLASETKWHRGIARVIDRESAETRRQILREAEEQKDWFAVVFHLRQLCQLHPEDADLQTRLHSAEVRLAEQEPLSPEFAPETP